MMAALGIRNFTQTSAYDFFDEIGVDKDFVLEFVDGASRDNYNQAGNINAFVDLVSLAGAGIDGSVFSLTNGTQQITEHLAAASGATVLVDANVSRIESVAEVAHDTDATDDQIRVTFQNGAGASSQTSFDAVVIATPDHWHAPICTAAMKAGKHVFCEKPLTHTVAESRDLRNLSRTAKVVTQTGNQGSASPNLRRSIELIQAGLLGQVSNVHVWHPAHGWPNGGARPAGEDTVPKGMNWDFWCGPSPLRPYKAGVYHPGKWRGWYDFGNGSVGDFCCHSFNMPVRALNLKYPSEVRISKVEKAGFETYAKAVTHTFHFPAEGKRAAVNLIYYTGGVDMPPVTSPVP